MRKIIQYFLCLSISFSLLSSIVYANESIVLDNSNTIILYEENQIYTGEAITPSVVVKVNDVELIENEDYTVQYDNNIEMGTGTIIVSGIEPYEGTIYKEFTITEPIMTMIPKQTITEKMVSYGSLIRTYNGNEIKPKVEISNLVKNVDYTVSYKNNVKPGTGKIIIQGIGNYTGTITKSFNIHLANTYITSLVSKDRGIKVNWKEASNVVSGYQIKYSRKSDFSTYHTIKVKGKTRTYKTLSGLSKGKKYYVRIRTYKNISGKSYYGTYSKKKSTYTNKPTKLVLNAYKKTIHMGNTYKIKVKSTGYSWSSKKVTYRSSNKSVATVNKYGVVSPKKNGTCTITVKTINGIEKQVKIKVDYRIVYRWGRKIIVKNAIVAKALGLEGYYGSCTAIAERAINALGYSARRGGYLSPESFLRLGKRVSINNAEPGDVIYYANGGAGCSHVAIYLGNGLSLQGNMNGIAQVYSVYLPYGSAPVFIDITH